MIRQQAPPIPNRATRAGTEGKPNLNLEFVQSTSEAFCLIKRTQAVAGTPRRSCYVYFVRLLTAGDRFSRASLAMNPVVHSVNIILGQQNTLSSLDPALPLEADLIPFYELFNGDNGSGLESVINLGLRWWPSLLLSALMTRINHCFKGTSKNHFWPAATGQRGQ